MTLAEAYGTIRQVADAEARYAETGDAFLDATQQEALREILALVKDILDGDGYHPAPPEHLADAWARFQAGDDVTASELRELDEWRTDVAWDRVW